MGFIVVSSFFLLSMSPMKVGGGWGNWELVDLVELRELRELRELGS